MRIDAILLLYQHHTSHKRTRYIGTTLRFAKWSPHHYLVKISVFFDRDNWQNSINIGAQLGMLNRLGDTNNAGKDRHIHTGDHGLSRS